MLDKDLRVLIHDLRNRIAPIRNATYLVRLRAGSDAQLQDATALIERQIEAMAGMLDAALPARREAAGGEAGGAGDASDERAGQFARRILIADDSPAVCESLAAILRDLGHEVRTAQDGQQAVDMATAWMPDFVLLDVNMPRLNGYEAARRLRSQFPSSAMRLVMISGADLEPAVLEAARQAGFDQCLDKLLDFGALKKLLDGAASPAL
jgi:CheY-like chemotaxis protein